MPAAPPQERFPLRRLCRFLAVFIYKINILALSVTYGDSSPKGRALGMAAKFPVKP